MPSDMAQYTEPNILVFTTRHSTELNSKRRKGKDSKEKTKNYLNKH